MHSGGSLADRLKQGPFQPSCAASRSEAAIPAPPGKLQPGLPRDLQTICMKCLEKDPRRSYRTATALADDLPRFLRSSSRSSARPIGPLERLAKWVNRRPYQAVLVAVATLDRSMHLIDAVLLELPNDRTVIREQLQSRTKRAMFLWQVRKEPTQPLSELKLAVADGSASSTLIRA